MVLHVYHASIGNKEFQFSTDITRVSLETYREDIERVVEEVSTSLLENLEAEDALCCACKTTPAVRLLHHTMLFEDVFPPRVEDLPQQICASSDCADLAKAQYMMDLEESSAAQNLESTIGCFACHKSQLDHGQSLLRCSRCKVARYCSATCQKGDWKIHKKVCAAPC